MKSNIFNEKSNPPIVPKTTKKKRRASTMNEEVVNRCANVLVQYPKMVLLLVVLAAGALCCIGFQNYAVEKDVSKLWIEDGSIVGGEVDYYNTHSYAVTETETQLMTTVRYENSGDNVLNSYTLDKHLKAAERIRDINVTFNGHVYKYEDVCYSLQPYLFQCTRITVLDCFKEGAYDFPKYHGIYTLDTVLATVKSTVVPLGETQIIAATKTNLVAYVESVGATNAALATAGTDITQSPQGSESYENALVSYAFLAQGNTAAATSTPGSETYNVAMMDTALEASFGTNCSALGVTPFVTYTSAYEDLVVATVASEYEANFVSGVEAQLVASIEANGLENAALAAAGTNITSSPVGSAAYDAALVSYALNMQGYGTTADLGDQYEPTLIAMALAGLSLGSIPEGTFTTPDVFMMWFTGNGCPVLSATSAPTFLCEQYSADVNAASAENDCDDLLVAKFSSEQLAETTIIPAVEANAVVQAESELVTQGEAGLVAYVEANGLVNVALASAGTNITSSPQGSDTYNAALISFALQAQTGYTTDGLGGSASDAYRVAIINVALSSLTSGTQTVESLGGRGSSTYDAFMVDLALQQAYGISAAALGGTESESYKTFALKLYWEQAAASMTGSCSDMNHTDLTPGGSVAFATVSEFYEHFVDWECPTIDTTTGTCATDSACKCQDNLDGITPYAARPSFYDSSTDLGAQVSSECYLWDNGLALPAVPTALVLGKPSASEGGNVYDDVEAYEFVLYTDSAEKFAKKIESRPYDPHTMSADEAQEVLDMWMDNFMAVTPMKVESDTTSPDGVNGYMVNTYSAKTFDDIIDKASEGAMPLLAAGLASIFLYAFVTTGFKLLALGGVCLVVLGTCGGLSLSLMLGIKLNATSVNVLPFLMLGLGVDDFFIFLRTLMRLKNQPEHARATPEALVLKVLSNAGPSVILTTITNFCAFMIGTLTPLPVVRDFALTAGITVIVSFFTDLIGFPALCVISMRYFPNFDLCGCCRRDRKPDEQNTKTTTARTDDDAQQKQRPGFVESVVVPVLTNTWVRVYILVLFVGIWIYAMLGIREIKMGLSVKQIATDGSQERDFVEIRDAYFAFYPSYLGSYENEFHTPAVQGAYLAAEQKMYDIEYNRKRVDSWMRQSLDWMNETKCESMKGLVIPVCGYEMSPPCAVNLEGYFDEGEERYYTCINQWWSETTVTSSPSFFPLSNAGEGNDDIMNPITYVSTPFYSEDLWETTDYVDLIDQTRDVLQEVESESGVRLFPVGTVFEYWEQYRNLMDHLYKNLGIATVCAFVIGTIAIFISTAVCDECMSIRSTLVLLLKAAQGSFIMVVTMVSSIVGLLGFMGHANIQLSAIPALTVIASMGICVDLTALLTLFFCSSIGTNDERIKKALIAVFIPTLDSMASTIMGCLALAFSPIELYVRYFFYMYVAVALIGTINGLVLLPVLLAWFGPSETEFAKSRNYLIEDSIVDVEGGPAMTTTTPTGIFSENSGSRKTNGSIEVHSL